MSDCMHLVHQVGYVLSKSLANLYNIIHSEKKGLDRFLIIDVEWDINFIAKPSIEGPFNPPHGPLTAEWEALLYGRPHLREEEPLQDIAIRQHAESPDCYAATS